MENKVIAKEYVDKNEVWKEIKGYEGFYEVSNFGRIRSISRYIKQKNNSTKNIEGKILKPILNNKGKGYLMVALSKNGREKRYYIHRLVAEAFISNKYNKKEVNHIDENPQNNKINNLEWVTHLENSNHGTRGKRISKNLKEWCKNNRVKKVMQISLNGIFIKEWESAKEVEKELGINSKGISLCATKRRKTAGGYKWTYILED